MKKILVVLAIVLIPAYVYAAEEKKEENILKKMLETAISPIEAILGPVEDLGRIVVAPTKTQEKLGSASSSVTSVKIEDTVKRGQAKLAEALRDIPATDVVEAGINGPTSVFIRGANSNHTLLLLDGVKLYDPVSTNGAFDYTDLTLDNIERLEVVRGAQSSLYGSDAIGGVVSLETKKAMNDFVEASVESGSYYTTHESFGMGAYVDNLHYTFGGSQFNTKGVSVAQAKNNNVERDPYDRTVFSSRIDYDLPANMTVGGTFRYSLSHLKYDNFGTDSPNLMARHENYNFTQYIEQKLFEWWMYKINLGWMVSFRQDSDDQYDGPNSNYLRDKYFGKYFKADFQNTFKVFDFDSIVVGYDYTEELAHSYVESYASVSRMQKVIARNGSFYLENRLNLKDRLTATQGMRVDHHSYAGTHITYKIDGSYLFPTATKVRGGIATGFKAPTLYQLNAPSSPGFFGMFAFGGGNPNLLPETSFSYEYGIDQYLFGEKLIASIVYFQNRFKNLIGTTTDALWNTSQYRNISKAWSYGVESELKFKPYDKLSCALSYTYMPTRDMTTDAELLRRAKYKMRMQLNWVVFPKFETDLVIRYTGPRLDTGQNKLKQYTTVDVAFNYDLTKNLTMFARIENLFNKFYEEVRLDGEPGINAYAGIRAKF